MIFEEINFLARNSFKSVSEAEIYRDNLENQLPVLKGKREILWRKHKSADENEKTDIFKEIKELTDKLTLFNHKKEFVIGLLLDMKRLKKIIRKRLWQKKNQKN